MQLILYTEAAIFVNQVAKILFVYTHKNRVYNVCERYSKWPFLLTREKYLLVWNYFMSKKLLENNYQSLNKKPCVIKFYVMHWTIWFHLHNLKNVKNTHGGVLILVKLQALACNFTKINTPPWVFFTFFELYKWYQIAQCITYMCLNELELHSSYKEFQNLLKRDLDSEVSNDTKFVWNGKEAAVNENNELDFLLKPEVSGP